MRLRRLALALAAALVVPACIDDWEQGAVTVGDEGVVRVLHHPCDRDNVVLSLRLMVPVGQVVGDGDDIVLWKVVNAESFTSSLVETFEPGNVPGGYREMLRLEEVPEKGEEVVIYLEARHGGQGAIAFDWASLSPGTVLTDVGPKSRSQWLDYAIEGCGGT